MWRKLGGLGVIALLAVMAGVCFGCPINTTIKITATDGINSGSQCFNIRGDTQSEYYEWRMDGSRDIVGIDGSIISSIDKLKLKIWYDPAASVEFQVSNTSNSAVTYLFTSDSQVFAPINNPEAYATAGITVTDRNQNGASITGLYGGKAYQARYNGSSVYANLVSSFTAGARKTVTQTEDMPADGGTNIIPYTLTSIDASFNFILSPKDSASGTSYFEVVPEPATIVLIGLGFLSLLRKRRTV